MPRGGFIKGSGRKKGVPNKKTQEAAATAERLGVDPFEILLLYSKRDWRSLGYEAEFVTKLTKDGVQTVPVISPELSASAAGKACEYLYPKRKSLEHRIDSDQFTQINRVIITRPIGDQP